MLPPVMTATFPVNFDISHLTSMPAVRGLKREVLMRGAALYGPAADKSYAAWVKDCRDTALRSDLQATLRSNISPPER
ncbi:MAG: hypothetical protein KKA30_13845 [Alphaproteobacteria bacterium]|nr:hypothetical protein [Alphaproteobacteria bacterium]MBU2307290.1 hypothetical protein [Alphaproteobacteria bacterium]